MISVNGIEARAFIEGIEIPIQSASIVQNSNSMSYASVVIPPVSSVPDIKPRSLLLIFVKDLNSYGGEEFMLQFMGETADPTIMWSSGGYSISISAYSLDNHWWAIPMFMMGTGGGQPNVFNANAKASGSRSGVASAAQESALLGTSIAFTTEPGGTIKVTNIGSSTLMEEFAAGSDSDIPAIFTVLYKANMFWKLMGTRTKMSSKSSYHYVGGVEIFGSDLLKFMKQHAFNLMSGVVPSNHKFIDWWELYRQCYFASWSLNHQSINKHVLITTGFEHMFPPACNIIFPHQFSMMSSIGQSLSNPTRTIGICKGLSGKDGQGGEDALITGGALFVAQPPELDDLMHQDATFMQAKEILPGTEEEWRGIVGNIILPNNALLTTLTTSGAPLDLIIKYFQYVVSDHHSKAHNSAGPSIVPCTFLPNIQVGFPAIAFRSSGSDITQTGYNVLYGYASSVNHFISATSATTNVTLSDCKLISANNPTPTPAPMWISDKGIDFFNSEYNTMLGCGSISAPASSLSQAFGSVVGTIGNIFSGIGSKLASGGAPGAVGSLNLFGSMGKSISGMGSGWVDVHGTCIEAVNVLGAEYELKKSAAEKVRFASSIVKRKFTGIQGALSSLGFEKKRAGWVNDYKAQLISEHRVVANEVGWALLNGAGDVPVSSMQDVTAEQKATVLPPDTTRRYEGVPVQPVQPRKPGDPVPPPSTTGSVTVDVANSSQNPPNGYTGTGVMDYTDASGNSPHRVKSGSAKSVNDPLNTADWHHEIKTTTFGGSRDPNDSGYSGKFIKDDVYGASLPGRIVGSDGTPARIEVFADGRSIIVPLVDVGPSGLTNIAQNAIKNADPVAKNDWNYIFRGGRPYSEYVTTYSTNKAGLDLTPAAIKALGIRDGSRVSWRFVK